MADIPKVAIALPSLDEQREIVDGLEKLNHKVSSFKSAVELTIETLAMRRTALIADAVTGKIDVRGKN